MSSATRAHNTNDAPFTCNGKLLGARQMLETYRAVIGAEPDEFDSARDDSGHGTHTASTAAGNAGVQASIFGRRMATISGIAPRRTVIAYKGLGEHGGFTSDLAAAIDQAVARRRRRHQLLDRRRRRPPGADEIAFLFAADAGVFVATSAGNSGPGAATVGNPATMPWITSVGASTQRRFFQGIVTLGNGKQLPRRLGDPGTSGARRSWTPLTAGSELCEPGNARPGQGDRQDRAVPARRRRPRREELRPCSTPAASA